MSTGDQKSNIYLKKFLPQQQMVDNFLEYLAKRDEENLKLQYPLQGYFYGNSMAGSGPDEITAATPSLATDGLGHLLKLDPSEAAAKFENNLGDTYYVGMKYNVREKDTEVNVRTGQIEYTFLTDAIGEKGEPTQVIDNGSTLRVKVDSIFEAGVSHAGRQVVVYLKRAVGQADAFFVGTVQFIGGENVVDTTHLIGQTAGLVSTDPTKYWVFAPGLTIRKFDISADPNYVFLGTVTGVGAGNTPTAGDIDNSGATVLYTGGSFTTLVNTLRSFMVGGGIITWELSTEELTLGATLRLIPASVPYNYQVAADTFNVADGECGYIELDGVGGVMPVTIADISAVPDDPKFQPIFYRYGNDIFFWMGSLELEGDATTPTSGRIDGVTEDLLTYLGATGESDSDPDYKNATGAPKENIHLTDGDNLTKAIKKLELRNDVVTKVRAVDFLSTVLPEVGNPTAPVIDGQTFVNGDRALFMDAALNGVYEVSGIGTSVVWTKLPVFSGGLVPVSLSLVGVQDGADEFVRTVFQYTPTRGWRPLNSDEIESEPTGFIKRTDSEIAFDEPSRTFTIQPKSPATYFYYVQKGKLYRVASAKTVAIPDTEGLHFIYFDGANLVSTQVFDSDIVTAKTFVSTLYWNSTANEIVHLADERHLVTMDGATHLYLHNTNGCQYSTGLGLSGSIVGDGSSDAHAQVSMDSGKLYDEDLPIDIVDSPAPSEVFEQTLTPIAQIPVLYREGATGDWKKVPANDFPLKPGAARPQWNELQAGPTWAAVDASADGKFIAMYIVGTNDINNPIIAIMGQREDNSLIDAQNNNNIESLDLTGLPTLEFKALYKIIYETNSGYGNTINARQVEFTDLRFSETLGSAGITPTDHNALSGRTSAGSHPSQAISTTVNDFGGAGSSLDTNAKSMLKTLDDHFKALRLHEHPSNKQRVVLTGASVTLNTGTVLEQQIRNLILAFDGIQIDFQTGEIFEPDGVTPFNGGANDFTPVIPPVGENRWASITLLPATVNVDNSINAQPLILISESDNFRSVFASGTKVGQVKLEEDTGSIADIVQAAITQQGVGGGGGSDGTGDADTFELEVRARLRRSIYGWVTTNIPSKDEFDLIDDPGSTATFDIANGLFKFTNIGDVLKSIQQYGAAFLATSRAHEKVELWNQFETEDAGMVHEVSRDNGLNWLTISMVKQGLSNLYIGRGVFPDPVNLETLKEYPTAVTPTTTVMTDLVTKRAVKIVVTEKSHYKTFLLKYNKTGSPAGSFYVNLVKDAAGSPSELAEDKVASSSPINSSSLLAGANNLSISVPGILPAGTYWFTIESDLAYRSSYVAATHQVALQADSAGTYTEGDSKQFDGTTWTTTAGIQILFSTTGFRFILLVRLTSSLGDVSVKDLAVFFAEYGAADVDGIDEETTFNFAGSLDKTDFLLPFLPDPALVTMEFVNAGLHFVFPFFDIDGHTLKVRPGTFLYPSIPNLVVKVQQKQGTAFDNNDKNASLLAANHLGSTDGAIDRSSAGRGIILRRPDGTLRELIINDSDNIEILSVP